MLRKISKSSSGILVTRRICHCTCHKTGTASPIAAIEENA